MKEDNLTYKKQRIVLVEDEDSIRENYCEILTGEGFQVDAYAERRSAFTHIVENLPDLVILDIGLGSEYDGGITLYREIRTVSASVPIIFLTSHDSESDCIKGMGLDVDDYITKKTSVDYLIVRIQTLLRRMNDIAGVDESNRKVIVRGGLILDTEASIAYWNDKRVDITLNQYLILQELAIRPGHVKSIGKLMVVAKLVVEPNTIVSNIKIIRKKFKEIDQKFNQIVAAYGKGYRWMDESNSPKDISRQ